MVRFELVIFLTLFGLTLALHGRREGESTNETLINQNSNASNTTSHTYGKESNMFVMGNREDNDKLIYKNVLPLRVFFLAFYKNVDLEFPDPKVKSYVKKITKIVVKNKRNNDKKWSVRNRGGGVGQNYVSLRVRGEKNTDIAIEIYGHLKSKSQKQRRLA